MGGLRERRGGRYSSLNGALPEGAKGGFPELGCGGNPPGGERETGLTGNGGGGPSNQHKGAEGPIALG